jgi:anti-anti-sigma factor
MTQILKEGGKTIIKTDKRIDTMNAEQMEKDIEPTLQDENVDLVMDCIDLDYLTSSGLRIIQKTMRSVMMKKGTFKMINVRPEIYKVLNMTGFTKFITIETIA